MLRVLIVVAIVMALPGALLAEESGVPGKSTQLFMAKCSPCHSVGEGVRIGPDLKGATDRRTHDWLATMIKTPGQILDSDPDGRALLTTFNSLRMPNLGLDDAQAESLIELLAYCSENPCKLAPELKQVTKPTEEDSTHGRDLFLGNTLLDNGGPPCISCHTVVSTGAVIAGGTLAKDLTHVFARLGDKELDAALRNASFPLMNKVYGDRTITTEEAFALRAYLYDANRGKFEEAGTYQLSVPLASLIGAIAVLILLNAAWSRRLRGVRKPLVHNQERSS